MKLHAEYDSKGEFVIFPVYTGNPVYDTILDGTEAVLAGTCAEAGRLYPVENRYKKAAIEKREEYKEEWLEEWR